MMGYNTTVVVLNDALSFIENDPEFGARLARAIQSVRHGQRVDVAAHSSRGGIHCNAATVIETHHADYDVYVRVGKNYGEPITYEQEKAVRAAEKREAKKRVAPPAKAPQ